MPTIDAGTYFLTALFPIKTKPFIYKPHDGVSVYTTPVLALRDTLASLPSAHQSEACLPNCNSPFARNTRNHFARFAVIDEPAFNGREQGGTLITAARKINPIVPQPVDSLNTAYLFFSSDFSCESGDNRDLDSYLTILWQTMHAELKEIFQFCHGFERVGNVTDFIDYVRRCQIETTMPFHDYWSPEESAQLPPVALDLTDGIFLSAFAFIFLFIMAWIVPMPLLCRLGLILAGAAALVYGLYRLVMFEGQKPFPAAAGADLPGVLKSLYLQNAFSRFAIDQQGADPAALHAAFGQFIQTTQPGQVTAPTQAPGVICA